MSQTLGTLRVELIADNAQFNQGMKQSRVQVMYFERALNAAAKAGRMVYAAGVRHGKKAIDTFAELEHSATTTAAILERTSKDTKDSFESLYAAIRSRATELSKETIFLPTQLADAMHQLAKAGRSPLQVMEDIGHAAKVAMATGGDITHMATEMGRISTMYPQKQMKDIATILTEATLRAPQMAGDVAAAIYRAGPLAKELGHTLEEVAAFSAFASSRGIQAGTAGRALQNILVRMLGFTKANEEQVKEWGLILEDANGNMRPLYEIFEDIKKYYKDGDLKGMLADLEEGAKAVLQESEGAPKKERELTLTAMQEISRFFRLRATPAAVPGIIEHSELETLTNAIRDSILKPEGPHEAISRRVMEDTTAGQTNRLISTYQAASASIAEAVKPELESIISGLQSVVNSIEGLSDAQKKALAYSIAGLTLGGLGVSQLPTLNTMGHLLGEGGAQGGGGGGAGGGFLPTVLSKSSAELIAKAISQSDLGQHLMSGALKVSEVALVLAVAYGGYKLGESISEQMIPDSLLNEMNLTFALLRKAVGLETPFSEAIASERKHTRTGATQSSRAIEQILPPDFSGGSMFDPSEALVRVIMIEDLSGNPEKLVEIKKAVEESPESLGMGE